MVMISSQRADEFIQEPTQSRRSATRRRLPAGKSSAFELIDHPALGTFEVISEQRTLVGRIFVGSMMVST
jgi:hypothetical protein